MTTDNPELPGLIIFFKPAVGRSECSVISVACLLAEFFLSIISAFSIHSTSFVPILFNEIMCVTNNEFRVLGLMI